MLTTFVILVSDTRYLENNLNLYFKGEGVMIKNTDAFRQEFFRAVSYHVKKHKTNQYPVLQKQKIF